MASFAYWDALTKPMPTARVEMNLLLSFDAAEAQRLKRGLIPQQMEDKWFGILRRESLDFYCSWTGYHIYRLPVEQRDGGIDVWPLIINSDPDQYTPRSDLYEFDTVRMLVRWMLAETR